MQKVRSDLKSVICPFMLWSPRFAECARSDDRRTRFVCPSRLTLQRGFAVSISRANFGQWEPPADGGLITGVYRVERDRFVSHLYQSRREYRRTCETAGKSGKQIERCVIASFRIAESLGFKGEFRHWEDLLEVEEIDRIVALSLAVAMGNTIPQGVIPAIRRPCLNWKLFRDTTDFFSCWKM